MENLAKLKKSLKVGQTITLVDTNVKTLSALESATASGGHKYINIPRTITKIQTLCFAMATDNQLKQGEKGSWIGFPKAGNYQYLGGGSFRFVFEYKDHLDRTYKEFFVYRLGGAK